VVTADVVVYQDNDNIQAWTWSGWFGCDLYHVLHVNHSRPERGVVVVAVDLDGTPSHPKPVHNTTSTTTSATFTTTWCSQLLYHVVYLHPMYENVKGRGGSRKFGERFEEVRGGVRGSSSSRRSSRSTSSRRFNKVRGVRGGSTRFIEVQRGSRSSRRFKEIQGIIRRVSRKYKVFEYLQSSECQKLGTN